MQLAHGRVLAVSISREGGAWGTRSDTKGERCGSSWSGAAVERAVGLCARVSKLASTISSSAVGAHIEAAQAEAIDAWEAVE